MAENPTRGMSLSVLKRTVMELLDELTGYPARG